MKERYEVVFYSGDQPFPAYYLIDEIECENLRKELRNKLARITQRVRKMFDLRDDILDSKIHEALYILKENGLIQSENYCLKSAYEWLKDNFKSFFNHGSPDWDWIRGKIKTNEKQ